MIEFNKEKHEYKVDGIIRPSVTTILKDVGIIDFSGIPKNILEAKSILGTGVHIACELKDKGILDYETLDNIYLPYLAAWEKFADKYECIIIENEKKIFSF